MGSILTLERAKQLIANSPVGSERYDDIDIDRVIETAEAQVADVVGPLTETSVTTQVWAGPLGAAMPGNGTVTAVTGWTGDLSTLSVAGGILTGLPPGRWTVTYTTGGTLPAPIRTAVEEQFKHIWSFRRGNTRAVEAQPGAAHAMPYRVTELLAPYGAGSRP